ncbi:radical SAM protein, partial [bacterium]|nr:radical SAM protein [bacterium]
HPKDLTDELIETMAKCKKVTPYINLPVQSGDDEILKRMNRPYTASHYKKLIQKLRSSFKKYRQGLEGELAISTDIIVGFPGETKKHFENTKKLVKEVGFFMAYIAQYSPRPGTAAYHLKDDVPPEEKAKREKELTEIVRKCGLKFNKKFVGKTVDALVLEKKKDFYFGKTRHYQTIKFKADKDNLIGNFVQLQVRKAFDFGLEGKYAA